MVRLPPNARKRSIALVAAVALAGLTAGAGHAAETTAMPEAPIRLDLGSGSEGATEPSPEGEVAHPAEPAFASAVLAGGALAFGVTFMALLAMALRSRAARRAGTKQEAPEASARPPADDAAGADDGLVSVSPAELAEAAKRAGIDRMLLIASSAPEFVEAVGLVRLLTRHSSSVVLIDFAYSHAAREMGIVGPVEDVLTTAASPTTLAHGINRDRSGRAHFLPVELGPIDGNRAEIREAAATVLSALSAAYEITVAVLSAADADCLDAMTDGNTAIVVPSRIGHPSAAAQTLDALAAHGIRDAVVMMVEASEKRAKAA